MPLLIHFNDILALKRVSITYIWSRPLWSEVLWRTVWFTAFSASSLQAVILPAKRFNVFKEIHVRLVPFLPSRLSSPSQFPHFYHALSFPFSLCQISLLALFFPHICHFFVLFFTSCSQCVAAAARPCQDQVVLKSWQRQAALPGCAGS